MSSDYQNSFKYSYFILVTILFAVVLFHLSILLGLLPSEITWGGKIKSKDELILFEWISISINLFMLIISSIKYRLISKNKSSRLINYILLIFSILMLLNTIANIFAETVIEKFFAVITLLLSLLFFKMFKQN